MRKAYSVFSPPFEVTSGGIRVMYGLYGWLLAKGEVAFLNGKFQNPDQCVAIYPEITAGNPMEASTVVRYILQTPGLMSSYGQPSPTTNEYQNDPQYKNDHFFVFSEVYNTLGVDENHHLFLPIINTKVFRDKGLKRHKTCYMVGKGVNNHQHPESAVELTRELSLNQEYLCDLLNQCDVLYCYDRLSAMMDIARLCGCRVKYYGELSPSDLDKYETGLNGIGYQSENRQLLVDEFRDHYLMMVDKFSHKLDDFIYITQS